MIADAGSIALFGLSTYGFKMSGVSNPTYLRAIKIVSAVVLAMVAWDPQRVNYSSQVVSLASSALLYAQGSSVWHQVTLRRSKPRRHRNAHGLRQHHEHHRHH